MESRPSRGAWIEIERYVLPLHHPASRAPRGARGLKLILIVGMFGVLRRAPRGARGLKYALGERTACRHTVAPLAGRVD